jgi:hypothetical protein
MYAVGKNFESTELQSFIESFKQKKQYQNILKDLKSRAISFSWEEDNYEVIKAFKADIGYEGQVTIGKYVSLKYHDNLIVTFMEKKSGDDESSLKQIVQADLLQELSVDKELTLYSTDDEEKVIISTNVVDENHVLIDPNTEDEDPLNHDENYVEGQLLTEVHSEAFFDGCLGGGYMWCGGGCGGGSRACSSSDNGINRVDRCCRYHDCCYYRNNARRPHCACDSVFCECIRQAPKTNWSPLIGLTFCHNC